MSQLKLEKHSSRKRSILLIIKLLIILVSVLGCAKNETYRDNIVPDISVNNLLKLRENKKECIAVHSFYIFIICYSLEVEERYVNYL